MTSDKPISENPLPPDRGFFAIVVLVAGISVWLLLMPFVTAIAQTTINRFHLRTGTFAQWVVQQPIPAMYNLANHYEVTRSSGVGDKEILESGMINHFPVRVITFGNGRYRMLQDHESCELRVTSSYRGTSQETAFFVDALDERVFVMSRIEDAEDLQ